MSAAPDFGFGDMDEPHPRGTPEERPEKSELLLVDFSSIYWIAYHVSGDKDADAPARMSVARVNAYAHSYPNIGVCLDAGRCWRHDRLSTYKANREAKPEEARAGMRNAIERLRREGFALWQADGFEADDVIASAVSAARLRGINVTIATADKDLMQLVGDGVAIVSTRDDGKVYGPAEVREKFGVAPPLLGDWLALVGDKSDNVPGCRGIGDVGATKLLERFGSLEGVLAASRAEEALTLWQLRVSNGEAEEMVGPRPTLPDPPLTPKLKQALVDNADQIRLSRELVALRSDVVIDLDSAFAERKPIREADYQFEKQETRQMSEEQQQEEPKRTNGAPPAPASSPEQPAETTQAPQTAEMQTTTVQEQEYAPPPNPTTTVSIVKAPAEWSHSLEPNGLADAYRLSKALHQSKLFAHFNNPEGIFAAMLIARSHGVETMKMLMPGVLHNIKGKLTMSAQLMVGLVLRSGKCEYFDLVESSMTKAVYVTKRKGAKHEIRYEYTIEEAKKLDNYKPDSAWMKSTKAMLRHRCETELARAVYPDVVGGLYTADEMGDDRVG